MAGNNIMLTLCSAKHISPILCRWPPRGSLLWAELHSLLLLFWFIPEAAPTRLVLLLVLVLRRTNYNICATPSWLRTILKDMMTKFLWEKYQSLNFGNSILTLVQLIHGMNSYFLFYSTNFGICRRAEGLCNQCKSYPSESILGPHGWISGSGEQQMNYILKSSIHQAPTSRLFFSLM